MIRKFTLTGLPMLIRIFSYESNTEAIWGTILAVIFSAYVNSVAPFVDDVDRRLSMCVQFHISITMTGGLSNNHMNHNDGRNLVRLSVSLFFAPQSDSEKKKNAIRKSSARNDQIRGLFGSPP
jgi:hypothetical protein